MLIAYDPDKRPGLVYGAMTNASGHFSISGIRANTYVILLERRGFVFVAGPKTERALGALILKSADQLQDVVLKMAPRAIISGRVLDEYGDPVMDANVLAIPVAHQTWLTQVRTQVATNDRGEFRLSLPPGKYYIKAFLWSFPSGPGEVRTDGSAESIYVETFYPNATETENGAKVEARAGQERNDVEIRLARTPSLTISGTVSGIPEAPAMSLSVIAEWGPDSGDMNNYTSRGLGLSPKGKPDGKFQLEKLRNGFYRVYARCSTADRQLESPAVEVRLADSSVEGLNLTLAPGFEVTGTVELAGLSPTRMAQDEARTIRLQPVGSQTLDRTHASQSDAAGHFRMTNVFAERYQVQVSPLPENGFVKTIWLNGTPVTDGILDFSSGGEGAQIKITLSMNGSQLSIRIQDSHGQPASPFIAVFLTPDRDHFTFDEIHFAGNDEQNVHRFTGLAPGRYRVIASESLTGGLPELAREMRNHTLSYETIEIKEGEHLEKIVKLPAKEETNGQE